MGDRYDSLQPPNLIAAIKSMPRRWADALYVAPPKNIEDFFAEVGPDGVSAAEDAGATLALVGILQDAIRTTSYNSPEALGSEVVAAMANNGSGPWPPSAADATESIEALMESLAERLDALHTSDWGKSASTPDGSVTLTELLRGAVRVAAERLARAERTIRSVS